MAHSTILGGSTAARLLACPASHKLSKDMPPQPTNIYAEEGTALHEIMEKYLDDDEPVEKALNRVTSNGIKIVQDMIAFKLVPARDALEDAMTRFDIEEFITEAHVEYTPVEGSFGSCDVLAKGRDNLVVVLDYKFGHVPVSPVENAQLMYYAIAAMHDPEYKDFWTGETTQPVVLGIIQPNDDRPDALWTWETTAHELVLMDMALRQAVYTAQEATSEPVKGDHCKYCPVLAVCPQHVLGAKSVNRLKDEHLLDMAVALALVEELEPWIKKVKQFSHEQLERGDKIEGYKLVNKQARRGWIDADDARKKLSNSKKIIKSDWNKESLVTPPQLEKICKAKGVDFGKFAEYIELRSSGTTVAPSDDKRSEILVETGDIPERMK
jgi:CRISPR/Cas system-associated exonuclease Cas4 (RecB family)